MNSENNTTETESNLPSYGPWTMLYKRLLHNRLAVSGALLLAFLYFISCFAGFLSPYRVDEGNPDATGYGPMLTGSKTAKLIGTFFDEEEDDEGDFIEVEKNNYKVEWQWFGNGVHFHDKEGNFTFRPHIHPLKMFMEYDEDSFDTIEHLAVDTTKSIPLEFFVEGEEEHELFSFCGFLPIKGKTHLFGVSLPEELKNSEEKYFAEIYLFGSDEAGRDLFSRLLYGGQISLSIGLIGILLSMTIGLIVGGIAGYFGGVLDFVSMRFVELLMAIPGLYLIITLRSAFSNMKLTSRQTYLMIVCILALAGWASLSRVIRGMVLSLRENEYVLAAQALGASPWRVLFRHILPNTASFVIVTATLYVPYYILGEVALSFLGLGITEPDTSWGLLLKSAQNSQSLKYTPWLVLPGFFIFAAVLAYNFLGDGLRDAADPRAFISRAKKPKSEE